MQIVFNQGELSTRLNLFPVFVCSKCRVVREYLSGKPSTINSRISPAFLRRIKRTSQELSFKIVYF